MDNLFVRIVLAIRLKNFGCSEGGQGRKNFLWNTPQNNLKPHFFCFTAVSRFFTLLVPSPLPLNVPEGSFGLPMTPARGNSKVLMAIVKL